MVELAATDTDFALVSALRSGDQNAMARLYDKYSSIVYAVALRVLGDTAIAEDILQEVFMQLWRNPGVFDSSRGNLAGWLSVIARNRAIDRLRREATRADRQAQAALLHGGPRAAEEPAEEGRAPIRRR